MPSNSTNALPDWSDWFGSPKDGQPVFNDRERYGVDIGPIQQISVYSAYKQAIWAIEVYYGDNVKSKYSNRAIAGSVGQDFVLRQQEYITEISYYKADLGGSYLGALQFTTNTGRVSPVMGNGGQGVLDGHNLTPASLPANCAVTAFKYQTDPTDSYGLTALSAFCVEDPVVSVELIGDVVLTGDGKPTENFMDSVIPFTLTNHSDDAQSNTLVYRISESIALNFTTNLTLTLGVSLTVGWDFLAKFELTMSLTSSMSFIHGETATNRQEHEVRCTALVPPGYQLKGTVTTKRREFNVTFQGTARLTHASGQVSEKPVNGQVTGKHEGFEVLVNYDKPTALTPQ